MGETIKSFLVGLGFSVDASSLSAFNKGLASAATRVAGLFAAVQVSELGIVKAVSSIAESFEEFGYATRTIAPAINKTLLLQKAMVEAYQGAGIDIKKAAQQSVIFNITLAKTKYALEAVYKSVGLKFIPVLTKQLDVFRKQIYANMPRIQSVLEKMVKFLMKAFEATIHLGKTIWETLSKVWDFFAKLDEATGGWSTKILAAVAAWKILNLSFLASPIGLIIAGLITLAGLFDDFKTWQRGGKSLFDWSYALPIINSIKSAVSSLFNTVETVARSLSTVFGKLLTGDFQGFFDAIESLGQKLIGIFQNVFDWVEKTIDKMGGLAGIVGAIGGAISSGAQKLGSGLLNFGGGKNISNSLVSPEPLVGRGGNTQHVSQQTNINVSGAADAKSTGQAIAGHQDRVNFDMRRNLVSPTR